MKSTLEPWILEGHKIFAEEGPTALKVEVLARRVNKNKSSFYHHFADLEIFKSRLLDFHKMRSEIILQEERACQNIDPDLLNVLVKFHQDLLFHRQLLVHRSIPEYEDLYNQITDKGIDAIISIWNKELNLPEQSNLGRRLLKMGLENLFQRASLENVAHDWLAKSFAELKIIANELRNSHALNGSV